MILNESAGEGLPAYRAVDPDIHVGQMPLDQCMEIQNTSSGQDLYPAERLDLAWLGLEISMAMTGTATAHRGPKGPFKLKELHEAKQRAQTGFRDILRDEQLPVGLRAAAGLALASVGVHHSMAQNQQFNGARDKTQVIPYLTGLQKAALPLLSHENRTPQDDDLLRSMTTIAMLGEYSPDKIWTLPTPTRQIWHINAVGRRHAKLAKLMITDEVLDGIMSIPPVALGNEEWGGDLPHATLHAYVQFRPGFALTSANKKNPDAVLLAFDKIARQQIEIMNDHEEVAPSPKLPATQEAARSTGDERKRFETVWYLAQPSGDIRNLLPGPLSLNISNLKEAKANGELTSSQENVLGWMQLEYARILTDQAQEKRQDAQSARDQEARVSRLDAKNFAATAVAADEVAINLMAEAEACFDAAAESFWAAAESSPPECAADVFEMRLHAEAVPVYKALFTQADTETIARAVDTYTRHLTGMYTVMRAAERTLRNDEEQLDALHGTAFKVALCLLVANSSDETARDLPLPASLREGGTQGQMDVTVFPMDHITERYDIAKPVDVQLKAGNDITHARQFVSAGLGLMWQDGDNPLGILAKLTAAAHAVSKPSRKQRRLRSSEIDDLSYRIGDAIVDASEA